MVLANEDQQICTPLRMRALHAKRARAECAGDAIHGVAGDSFDTAAQLHHLALMRQVLLRIDACRQLAHERTCAGQARIDGAEVRSGVWVAAHAR